MVAVMRFDWFHFLPLVALVSPVRAVCPSSCSCNDELLEVDCAGAQLNTFPISLNPRLLELKMSGNDIRWLEPGGVSSYRELRVLDLDNIKLMQLEPNSFIDLRKLQHLSLSENQLQKLHSDTLVGLQRLLVLDLSGNHLLSLPSGFLIGTPLLEDLSISDNRLSRLRADVLADGVSLRRLRLSGNRLGQFPDKALLQLPRLDVLDLADNNITKLGAGQLAHALPSITDLNLAGNPLSHVDPAAFNGLTNLRRLVLSGTGLHVSDMTDMSSLSSLEQLFLDGVHIRRLSQQTFHGVTSLRLLSARHCPNLTAVEPGAFDSNPGLVSIRLDGNRQLLALPADVFSSLRELRHLDLSNTGLVSLPVTAVPSWSKLDTLRLSGTRFQCDCVLSWLTELQNDTGATCEEPLKLRSRHVYGLSPVDDLQCGAEQRRRALLLAASICGAVLLLLLMTAACLLYRYRRKLRRNMKGAAWGDHMNVDKTKVERVKKEHVSGTSYRQMSPAERTATEL